MKIIENNKIMKTVFYKNRENDENQVKSKIEKIVEKLKSRFQINQNHENVKS